MTERRAQVGRFATVISAAVALQLGFAVPANGLESVVRGSPIIALNAKCHSLEHVEDRHSLRQVYTRAIVRAGKHHGKLRLWLAPATIDAKEVRKMVDEAWKAAGTIVRVGAQDVHHEGGAYTGEHSVVMLKPTVDHVIIGHSERRQFFGNTDAKVNQKILAALDGGLRAVFCVGETEAERDAQDHFGVVERQIKEGLKGIPQGLLGGLVVAYEPVWAIGTGKTAKPAEVQEMHAHIRNGVLPSLMGSELVGTRPILYGGSVKPDNTRVLMELPDVDGALIGGSGLKMVILKVMNEAVGAYEAHTFVD